MVALVQLHFGSTAHKYDAFNCTAMRYLPLHRYVLIQLCSGTLVELHRSSSTVLPLTLALLSRPSTKRSTHFPAGDVA